MELIKLSINEIKCDNPNCDFKDKSVTFDDYINWVNKPCPKCGANLLTQADYDACKKMVKTASIINSLFSFLPGKSRKAKINNKDTKEYVLRYKMNGSGNPKLTDVKIR